MLATTTVSSSTTGTLQAFLTTAMTVVCLDRIAEYRKRRQSSPADATRRSVFGVSVPSSPVLERFFARALEEPVGAWLAVGQLQEIALTLSWPKEARTEGFVFRMQWAVPQHDAALHARYAARDRDIELVQQEQSDLRQCLSALMLLESRLGSAPQDRPLVNVTTRTEHEATAEWALGVCQPAAPAAQGSSSLRVCPIGTVTVGVVTVHVLVLVQQSEKSA